MKLNVSIDTLTMLLPLMIFETKPIDQN